MSDIFIYGLIDPRPERLGEIRYVGKTETGMSRPKALHSAKCGSWQRAVRKLGLQEEVWVIEEWDEIGSQKQWLNDAEIFWIGCFKMVGADLTNMTKGGTGGNTGKWSDARRAKFAESMSKVPRTPEWKANISEGNKGKVPWTKGTTRPESTRKKTSQTMTGRAYSEERRRAIGEGRRAATARKKLTDPQ